jgi:PAS domain S-box-containing protein
MTSLAHKNESLDHFEAFFEYATMGIIITQSSGHITAANPFALKEFGYTLQELIGKKVELLIPARFHENHIHYHENFINEPETRIMGRGRELFAVKKDGTEFPTEISLGNYYKNGNKFVIAFICNITERKKAEKKIIDLNNQLETIVQKRTKDLQETMNELQLSKDKLQIIQSFQKAILDNAGAMIIATDKDGVIKLFNPEASWNIGYTAEEIINKKTPLLFHDISDINRKRKALLKEFGITLKNDFDVLVEKAKRNIHNEEQYTYLRKNGTSFPVSLTITSMKDNEGVISGFMGIAIDISERKKIEEDLLNSLEKEKELNELKSRFVSMASHEFRTPLSTVLSSAYLIEKYAKTDEQPKREKHLQRIISSVSMLSDILNDFLSLGKIEEGKIQVKLTIFNIKELVMTSLKELKNNLKNKQHLRYYHTGNTDVFLDASLLIHIVMNLVSNASKFSPEGSIIKIKTINSDEQLIFSIEDQGIGISKEDQRHLMERFFRGSNASNIQGTGLGLHLVAKYAELMNGKVSCKSELEKGAQFTINFINKKVNA